ncbi:uncharacterized protein J7T54_007919 [Emericellopsis cladophorae]|uniref:FAD linked oxidase N-terminal domain-containing protein n=1 Tax=Emericellopsis cladophorae TaxID=2686198 RepID=A0A9P9Y7B8_9HYPO|nr:uncharacterized protein J7T54_007919 [Emericellopsis cladophorae]KAI6784826.1 hypothetical protein J7T54_007919 [Emericellopsis cladophorae]
MAILTLQPAIPQAQGLISAGLQSRILSPTDADFTARQESYWSNSAKITPACTVQPQSAEEVAISVKAPVAAGQKFGVRSGGHTNWAGSKNIQDGVTSDLREVYAELDKHRRAVTGGRGGNVGAAGLLLGGGNTFFTARQGFACDNIVSYRVVLANGTVVNADEQTNTDLFHALKGGSINFGVATGFTMTDIRYDKVWGGMTFFPKQAISGAIEVLSSFTDNVPKYINSNLVTIFTHMPDFKDIVVATLYANLAGIKKPPAYKK